MGESSTGNILSATGSCLKPHWGLRSLDLVCCSVCVVSQMRSLMNISPLPHGAPQQSRHLCPPTASSSSTEKALLPAARISSPPRWPLLPFLFWVVGMSVPPAPGQPRPCGGAWRWGWPRHACLSELQDAPSGVAARGYQQQGQGLEVFFRHLSVPPASSANFQFVPIQPADR